MDDDALNAIYGSMPEAILQENVRRTAITLGWLYYHTHDSRHSDPGFPDTVMVRGGKILYRECKTQKGRLSAAQIRWLAALDAAGADAGVWRPFDWGSGRIMRELT